MRGDPSALASEHVDSQRRLLVALIAAAAGSLTMPPWSCVMAEEPSAVGWQSVLQTLFPQSKVDPALYAIPAGALVAAADEDPAAQSVIWAGWRSLNSAVGGNWTSATPEARRAALRGIVGTPLFGILRRTVVFTFYNDPRVWAACGYEGDAWRFGGYAGPGLITVDWLPEAAT